MADNEKSKTEHIKELEELAQQVKELKRRRQTLSDEDIKVATFEVKLPFRAVAGLLGGMGVRPSDPAHDDVLKDIPDTH